MMRKFSVFLMVLVVLSLMISACQPTPAAPQQTQEPNAGAPQSPSSADSTEPPAETDGTPAAESKVLTVVNGPTDINSLDPSILEDVTARQVANEIFGGLTFVDEVTSEVQPNLARDWDISEDGRVYTFHLRDDVPWVKYNPATGEVEKTGRMVNAEDFRKAMIRTLKPETASAYAYLIAWNVEGAKDFNEGVTTDEDTVGIKVLDEYTLEITFLQPAAFNVSIAGMSMNYAQPSWVIEAYEDQWTDPANIETYGPFALKEWIHDDRIVLVKNPFYPGTEGVPAAKIDVLVMLFREASAAMAEYEAGNVDWVAVPTSEIERVQTDPVLGQEFTTSPRACTMYYLLNTMSPFTDDLRIRKALTYSVDRQALVDYVTKAGEVPARTMIHPSLAGAPDPEKFNLGPTLDVEFAKAQLDEYLTEKGLTVNDIDITLGFNSSELNQEIAEAVQQMWKTNLGIQVQLQSIEAKVYWAMVDSPDMPQVARLGWCPVYYDADYFIRSAFRSGGMNNEVDEFGNPSGGVRWLNEEFDSLVDQAAAELDDATRQELYARAEEIISTEDVVFIPLYHYSSPALTKPYVTRTFSVGGVEAYEKWDIDLSGK